MIPLKPGAIRNTAIFILTLLVAPGIRASQYFPTPMTEALQDHAWVIVGRVAEQAPPWSVKVAVVATLKGEAKETVLTLPSQWRTGNEMLFPGVRFAVGKHYRLMLRRNLSDEWDLSNDLEADAVEEVDGVRDPKVRHVVMLLRLMKEEEIEARMKILDEFFRNEDAHTHKEFFLRLQYGKKDPAVVPFLLKCIVAKGNDDDSSMRHYSAVGAIKQHQYREAIPELVKMLDEPRLRDSAARLLGALKAKEAEARIVSLLENPKEEARRTLLEALQQIRSTE